MASRNKTPREIYPGFSDYVIWNFLFQRQFYQPAGSQQQFPYQQHAEALFKRCFVKNVFLKISQNSQENTCARVCFLIRLKAYLFS